MPDALYDLQRSSNSPIYDKEMEEDNELEEALQDAWKQKTAKFRLEEKIEKANVQLQFMIDMFSGMGDKDFYVTKLTEIKNSLKVTI
jgi:hypothetical protein